jgi:ATP-dependent Clp protease ATP-binding subunit ClpA
MDKFLQILEDGRMTDGQGNTVYFTETLIFFTSNVGISREVVDPLTGKLAGRENIVSPGEQYEVIREKVEEAMKTHFKPEVINRIGENIAVFNYIDAAASKEIADSQIIRINGNILKENKITVNVRADAYDLLYEYCLGEKARHNGGRGIGNVIEEQYLNPLAEFIFDQNCVEGDAVNVARGSEAGGALTFIKEG